MQVERAIESIIAVLTGLLLLSLASTIIPIHFVYPFSAIFSIDFLTALGVSFIAFFMIYLYRSFQQTQMQQAKLQHELIEILERTSDISTNKQQPESLLSKEALQFMPPLPKDDLNEATRALSSNAPTAAAMAALRAAEYSILDWYEFKTGEEPEAIPWPHLVTELEGSSKFEIDSDILSEIHALRDTRNRVMHAETNISQQEATKIIRRVTDLVNHIYVSMQEEQGEAQT